jgi:hypothetical protein
VGAHLAYACLEGFDHWPHRLGVIERRNSHEHLDLSDVTQLLANLGPNRLGHCHDNPSAAPVFA